MTRSANPSMGMVEVHAANAQAGSYQEPKIGDSDKRRKGSMDSRGLGPLAGLLKQMKSSYSNNRCDGDHPVCNRRKSGSREENSADAEQQSVTKRPLIQRL